MKIKEKDTIWCLFLCDDNVYQAVDPGLFLTDNTTDAIRTIISCTGTIST